MKQFLLFVTVAVAPAFAQWHHFGGPPPPGVYSETQVTGYAGLGFAAPMNPGARNLDTGFSLEGGVGITRPYVGLMFDAMFTDFGMNNSSLLQQGARNGSQRYWGLTVDPVFHVNERGPVDFYVTGGAGVYGQVTKLKTTLFNPQNVAFDATSTDTHYGPGVDGGAGFAFNLSNRSRTKLFLEARFHHMFLENGRDANFIPVTLGVRF